MAGDENAGAPAVDSFDEPETNAGASGHGDASLEAAGIIREGALRSRGLASPLREPAPLRAPNVVPSKESQAVSVTGVVLEQPLQQVQAASFKNELIRNQVRVAAGEKRAEPGECGDNDGSQSPRHGNGGGRGRSAEYGGREKVASIAIPEEDQLSAQFLEHRTFEERPSVGKRGSKKSVVVSKKHDQSSAQL